MDAWAQRGHGVRVDWGLAGARAVAGQVDVAVVVDVLSFTTTVSVAADLGVAVLPFGWRDARAAAFAREHDAVLAVGRREAGPGQVSLSPATLRRGAPPRRLVLPSPNGSTLAQHVGGTSTTCLGASLRNARAVSRWLTAHHEPGHSTVAVLAAGERWPDGGLRPAVEDLWGAGAVVDHLVDAGWSARSPEADAARAAWRQVAGDVRAGLLGCASGLELVRGGYAEDVLIAAEAGASSCVPVLDGLAFVGVGA